MKKHLQNLFALAILSSSLTVVAQPTLTGANTNPTIGEIFATKTTTIGVTPGSAGANQTWNLTGLGAGTSVTVNVVSVASTPSAASFPAANTAFYDGTTYAYATNTSASSLNQGNTAGGVLFAYSNPETILSFPVNFNNVSTDSWQCTFTNASITFTRSGTTTVTADGWGTVTTPANTYSNTMRLHFVQTYTDVSASFTITYTNDEYFWYTPGIHNAVAATYTVTNSFTTPFTGGTYLSSVVTGVNSFAPLAYNISLFPNPASENINVAFTSEESGKAELKIFDVTGKQLQNISEVAILPGDNRLKINTNELPAGAYFMSIYMNKQLQKNERFVVAH
ncbi:MAG: T9SS type A sorting domain-containing protein [Bacteroidota bacterium]|nr:T9SS type A sorting domain-containing protein [Bacteroidota bacterium]